MHLSVKILASVACVATGFGLGPVVFGHESVQAPPFLQTNLIEVDFAAIEAGKVDNEKSQERLSPILRDVGIDPSALYYIIVPEIRIG